MQEFLTNNTVSCNLMSLTGYRTLVILSALLDGPKSNDEINDILLNNQYIKENFSSDTLRVYINSLRAVGCDISRANKTNGGKYVLTKHPFNFDVSIEQIQAVSKIYKSFYKKLYLKEILQIENCFRKLCGYIQNKKTIDILRSFSLLKNVDRKILDELLIYSKNKNQITILYNSPKSGRKKIQLIVDKVAFKSERLYLYGYSLTHDEYSYFQVERILQICEISLLKTKTNLSPLNAIYEIYNHNEEYILENDEEIIEKTNEKLVIASKEKNEFELMQRILHMANNCKVIQPESFKQKIVKKLKAMEKSYEKVQ